MISTVFSSLLISSFFVNSLALTLPNYNNESQTNFRRIPGGDDAMYWYSDPDVTKCSSTDSSVSGAILRGKLNDHRYNFESSGQGYNLGASTDGACYNLDSYVLNADNNNNDPSEKSTVKKFGVFPSDHSYSTIVLIPRANCDIQPGDIPAYAYLNQGSCFKISSAEYAIVLSNAGVPDIQSFWIYKPAGTASTDQLTCGEGVAVGTNQCSWVPLQKPPPPKTTSSTLKPTSTPTPVPRPKPITKLTSPLNPSASPTPSRNLKSSAAATPAAGNPLAASNVNINISIDNAPPIPAGPATVTVSPTTTTTPLPTFTLSSQITVTPSTPSLVYVTSTMWVDP